MNQQDYRELLGVWEVTDSWFANIGTGGRGPTSLIKTGELVLIIAIEKGTRWSDNEERNVTFLTETGKQASVSTYGKGPFNLFKRLRRLPKP